MAIANQTTAVQDAQHITQTMPVKAQENEASEPDDHDAGADPDDEAYHKANSDQDWPREQAMPVINRTSNTPANLVSFAHATLFTPALYIEEILAQRFFTTVYGTNGDNAAALPPVAGSNGHGPLRCPMQKHTKYQGQTTAHDQRR